MDKIIVDCSTGIEQIVPMTQEEIQQRAMDEANNIRIARIDEIKRKLIELDHIIPRVVEDIIAQGTYSIHPSKLTIIAEKNALRIELQSL